MNAKTQTAGALKVSAAKAKAAYLMEALAHLNEFGKGRAASIAYALFPARGSQAAYAATKRVLAGACKRGLVEHSDEAGTQFRYYALTRRGAAYLNERIDLPGGAHATTTTLNSHARAAHREWTTLLTLWARNQQGLEPVNEFALWGVGGQGVRAQFAAVPDGLTFDLDPAQSTVYWHEIELSRRSQWTQEETAKAKKEAERADKVFRGSGKHIFQTLLRRVQQQRYVVRGGREFNVCLVLHCASEQIKRELSGWIEATFKDNHVAEYGLRKLDGGRYSLNYAGGQGSSGTGFNILLVDLPENPAVVWHDDNVFPFPAGAGFERKEQADAFLKS